MAIRLLSALALLSFSWACAAADPPESADHAGPWYDIELIVFTRESSDARNSEFWPDDPGMPELGDARWLNFDRGAADARSPVAFATLPSNRLRLGGITAQLRSTRGQLNPILHLGWRQPLEAPARAKPVRLRSTRQLTFTDTAGTSSQVPVLEGTISVGAKRYLHVNLDLVLRELAAQRLDPSTIATAPRQASPAHAILRQYRMQASRRMRSGELHYLDHPLMGVLLLATRYRSPEATKEDTPISREATSEGEIATPVPASGEASSDR